MEEEEEGDEGHEACVLHEEGFGPGRAGGLGEGLEGLVELGVEVDDAEGDYEGDAEEAVPKLTSFR